MRPLRPLLLLVVVALGGCPRPALVPVALDPGRAYPMTPAQAEARRAAGERFDDCEIRRHYNKMIEAVAAADRARRAQGRPAEERARAAFDTRHDARMTARAMMADRAEVDALRARDQSRYGNPDGPTFELLVEKNRARGLRGDAVFDEIIQSAQRTDEKANEECGIHR